jgi:hypothetical protein
VIAGQSSRLQLLGHSAADAAGGEQPLLPAAAERGRQRAAEKRRKFKLEFYCVPFFVLMLLCFVIFEGYPSDCANHLSFLY